MFDLHKVDIGGVRKYCEEKYPLGRIRKTEEVAELIAYIASEKSSFITGADFVIDGGAQFAYK